MACKLPMTAESRPYCMLAMATVAHMSRHFLFAQRDVSCTRVSLIVPEVLGWLDTRWSVGCNFMSETKFLTRSRSPGPGSLEYAYKFGLRGR